MEMFKFQITMKHDQGEVKITTWASSIQGAVQQVLTAERAPERAIINIRRMKE